MQITKPDLNRRTRRVTLLTSLTVTIVGGVIAGCMVRQTTVPAGVPTGFDVAGDMSPQTLAEGRQIFRFDTFGDEQFWTDTARMHEVVQRSVSPATALSVGLKPVNSGQVGRAARTT